MKFNGVIFSRLWAVCAVSFVFSSVAAADDFQHYPAKPSPTVEAALCHLSSLNPVLSQLTSSEKVKLEDMVKIHELTYTLENALGTLQAALVETAERLEEVHKASERFDQKTVVEKSVEYRKLANQFISPVACD